MANSLQVNQSGSIAGLGTFSFTVVTAGPYTIACNSTVPPSSGLQIVLNQNSTPLVTVGGVSTDPTPTQQSIGTSARVNALVGDVISAVLSSANAVDNFPNSVKSVINLYQGF